MNRCEEYMKKRDFSIDFFYFVIFHRKRILAPGGGIAFPAEGPLRRRGKLKAGVVYKSSLTV